MGKLSSAQWSAYWTNPIVTTIDSMFGDNYDGQVAQFWREVIQGDPGVVLDLACGNGALCWLANNFLNNDVNRARIIGVDAANINPFEVLGKAAGDFPTIRFIGDTPLEHLPFEDGSADVAISQYGLEYSDLSKSIPEIARVLGQSARMGFIVHGSESTVVRCSTLHLAEHKYVFEKIRIHEHFADLDRLIGTSRDLSKLALKPKVRKVLVKIDKAAKQIGQIVSNIASPGEIDRYFQPMNREFTAESVRSATPRKPVMLQCYRNLKAYIERVEDLQSAALSPAEQDGLVDMIEKQGFEIKLRKAIAHEGGENIGTALFAERGNGKAG